MIYELFLPSYNILHGLHGPSCWLTEGAVSCLNGAWIGDATHLELHEGILCPMEIQYFFRSDIERGVGSLFTYSIMCNGHLVPLKRKW